MNNTIQEYIDKASKVIGNTWPLYAFVTSNPLSGYEQMSFEDATILANKDLGAKVFPDASVYKQAWDLGEIDKTELVKLLQDNYLNESPENYLQQLETAQTSSVSSQFPLLDVIVTKWLSAFMDEGLAEWQMPNKELGFYKAWRKLAKYDDDINIKNTNNIPLTSSEALETILEDIPNENYEAIFRYHLAALPGWTGYINHRNQYNSPWQQTYPISLLDYLAVRLWIAINLNLDIYPKADKTHKDTSVLKLKYLWLQAWEKSFQNKLVKGIKKPLNLTENNTPPDAQLVFCIDTRSELIRRHIESKGNYETYGYAGFFGIAMDYENLSDGIQRQSCPPILNSAYTVTEKPQDNKDANLAAYNIKNNNLKFSKYFRKRMKNMLPSTFGYVEGSGVFYGLTMIARTLLPSQLYNYKKKNKLEHESFSETTINPCNHGQENDIPLEEKTAIVKSAFDLTGWATFAPLVVFAGHGGHSANNPFDSSLDCGACAASPGRHNARMLAKLANDKAVRKLLLETHNLEIPENTVFIGAEHNTTTDEIKLFDTQVPSSHQNELKALKASLFKAQETATQERLGVVNASINSANKKANDWSETRPEWGLAKNAGFIIGSRSLTKDNHLDGRCFLHSYDWKKDTEGKALEGIMQGPMTVTQWINNHYYFSTVDNKTFGGGTKITHNITGNFGVVQGNGGDLKMGLPLQSLNETDNEMYHQPLRLSVIIHAPLSRVSEIIARNQGIKNLLDNNWIYLMVMNSENNNELEQYQNGINWKAVS